MNTTIRAALTALTAAAAIITSPGLAHATHDGDLRNTSDDTVYYRYGSANTLAYATAGTSAPGARDVNLVQVNSGYRLTYRIAYPNGTTSGLFYATQNVGVLNGWTVVVTNYDRY